MIYLVGLAASDPTTAPLWASLVAVIAALVAIIPRVLDFAAGKREAAKPTPDSAPAPAAKPDPLAAVLTELTRAMNENAQAYGRLADVLDRIESANEKAWEKILRHLEESAKAQERLDYRTKEIRDDVKQLLLTKANNGD